MLRRGLHSHGGHILSELSTREILRKACIKNAGGKDGLAWGEEVIPWPAHVRVPCAFRTGPWSPQREKHGRGCTI